MHTSTNNEFYLGLASSPVSVEELQKFSLQDFHTLYC